jgi:hypothetical protein
MVASSAAESRAMEKLNRSDDAASRAPAKPPAPQVVVEVGSLLKKTWIESGESALAVAEQPAGRSGSEAVSFVKE